MASSASTLLLVRHGRAEGAPGLPDAERHLTPEGVAELRAACAGLQALGVRLDAILTSPLVRAVETAVVLSAAFASGVAPITTDVLAPGAAVDAVVAALRRFAVGKTVALVGHAPDLSNIVVDLIAPGTRRSVFFPPGGVACLEFDDMVSVGRGRLQWSHTPLELAAAAAGAAQPDPLRQ